MPTNNLPTLAWIQQPKIAKSKLRPCTTQLYSNLPFTPQTRCTFWDLKQIEDRFKFSLTRAINRVLTALHAQYKSINQNLSEQMKRPFRPESSLHAQAHNLHFFIAVEQMLHSEPALSCHRKQIPINHISVGWPIFSTFTSV